MNSILPKQRSSPFELSSHGAKLFKQMYDEPIHAAGDLPNTNLVKSLSYLRNSLAQEISIC